MNHGERILEDVERSLALRPWQAAERHIQRVSDGWDLQFGFWPFEQQLSVSQVTSEVTSALGFHVTRRSIDLQVVEIDACSIGFEKLHKLARDGSRLIRGVGIWFPLVVEISPETISGSDDA